MLPSILSLIAIASIGWVGFMFILKRYFGFSFVLTPILSLVYFVLQTGVLYVAFPTYVRALYGSPPAIALIFFIFIVGVCNPLIYKRVRTHTKEIHPDLEFLRIDRRFLVSKIGDVGFQQTAFGVLLLLLAGSGMPVTLLMLSFACLFALGHLGMFLRVPHHFALYFLLCGVALSIPLAFLILYVAGGIYYAIALHMLWYVLGGAFFASRP